MDFTVSGTKIQIQERPEIRTNDVTSKKLEFLKGLYKKSEVKKRSFFKTVD